MLPVKLETTMKHKMPSRPTPRYLGPSRVDDSAFRKGKGYWVYVNASEGGTLVLPGAGGSVSGQNYLWSKLRFSNGTTELNWSDALNVSWAYDIYYWKETCDRGCSWDLELVNPLNLGDFNVTSLESIFIKSNSDNITLIRQN